MCKEGCNDHPTFAFWPGQQFSCRRASEAVSCPVHLAISVGHELGHLEPDGRQSRQPGDPRPVLLGSPGGCHRWILDGPPNAHRLRATPLGVALLAVVDLRRHLPPRLLAAHSRTGGAAPECQWPERRQGEFLGSRWCLWWRRRRRRWCRWWNRWLRCPSDDPTVTPPGRRGDRHMLLSVRSGKWWKSILYRPCCDLFKFLEIRN